MNAEDDTLEIPPEEPKADRDAPPEPDLGPWGAEAVQLGEQGGGAVPKDRNAHDRKANSRRWVALAAVVCAASAFSVLGALILSGSPVTKEIGSQKTPKASRRPPVAERTPSGSRTARRSHRPRRQAGRRALHHRSTARPAATHSVPNPIYTPSPHPAPATEPVAPSPTPAPAPEPTRTTRPPPASGSAVAKEFGFER